VRFLVDNQLPPALARFIQYDLGAEALHVVDLNMRETSDRQVWRYASANGLIIVSKDEDFVNLYSQAPTAGLLWVRLGNCRRAHLLGVLQRAWPRIAGRFASGDQFVELR
jgi:predicted nuclease of predicted toxin-antitoxin system